MNGTENYTIVTNGYKFSVKAGQFDATATKLETSDNFADKIDLTHVVKSAKAMEAGKAPTVTDQVKDTKWYTSEDKTSEVTVTSMVAGTTYYYIADIGNAEVAIYAA